MPDGKAMINIEPCSECPIPPNFIIKQMPSKKEGCTRYDIECRECDDKWTEIIEDE